MARKSSLCEWVIIYQLTSLNCLAPLNGSHGSQENLATWLTDVTVHNSLKEVAINSLTFVKHLCRGPVQEQQSFNEMCKMYLFIKEQNRDYKKISPLPMWWHDFLDKDKSHLTDQGVMISGHRNPSKIVQQNLFQRFDKHLTNKKYI